MDRRSGKQTKGMRVRLLERLLQQTRAALQRRCQSVHTLMGDGFLCVHPPFILDTRHKRFFRHLETSGLHPVQPLADPLDASQTGTKPGKCQT